MESLNRRKAIRERCMECSNYVCKEVRDCPIIKCPLYPFRMGRGKQDPDERKKAIRQYCLGCMGDQPKLVRECWDGECALWDYRMGKQNAPKTTYSDTNFVHIEDLFVDISGEPIPEYAENVTE